MPSSREPGRQAQHMPAAKGTYSSVSVSYPSGSPMYPGPGQGETRLDQVSLPWKAFYRCFASCFASYLELLSLLLSSVPVMHTPISFHLALCR